MYRFLNPLIARYSALTGTAALISASLAGGHSFLPEANLRGNLEPSLTDSSEARPLTWIDLPPERHSLGPAG
jgi:hypothetical protein